MKSWRFSLAITFVLLLSLVFVFVFMKTGTAQTEARSAPFKGKIVVVSYVNGPSACTIPLEQAQVQKVEDRYFLIGKAADEGSPNNWMKGCMTWIPLNNITSMFEMNSVEEMRKAWKTAQNRPPTPEMTQPFFGFAGK